MIDYRAGIWGFQVAFGWNGSLAPRALTMAVPNAVLTFIIATVLKDHRESSDFRVAEGEWNNDTSKAAQMVIAAFTSVMAFILYNRSNTAYDRWWEGGTLLQKTRGEWFNAFSSIMAFTSTKPEMQDQVDSYVHLLARLMSLLMCCGLQQVSPNWDRPFEIIDLEGIEPTSMEFLNSVPDKVEIILQWIQRSMVLHVQTGVLPVAPPILSRAFQEVSRGIVNLQNARKIADFPYPYPLAQVSMILQLLHWAMIPVTSSLAAPRGWAVLFSFLSIFVLWCIHFNALDLEFPFGNRVNDLPMHEMQQDWNKSVYTLLDRRATKPPKFAYDAEVHNELTMVMSDASDLYIPTAPAVSKGLAVIKVSGKSEKRNSCRSQCIKLDSPRRNKVDEFCLPTSPPQQGDGAMPAVMRPIPPATPITPASSGDTVPPKESRLPNGSGMCVINDVNSTDTSQHPRPIVTSVTPGDPPGGPYVGAAEGGTPVITPAMLDINLEPPPGEPLELQDLPLEADCIVVEEPEALPAINGLGPTCLRKELSDSISLRV
eukprot:TRINITY_DN2721_c0_g3_i2.p1 TRINITY_DN2721_c0_g3~~TRINITY_DN2721_c0_g3_i2.p1  ORF type:complete len:580 (-),score=63.01 TRINITY_DN2721_c0_g3_i2:124-1749(-)